MNPSTAHTARTAPAGWRTTWLATLTAPGLRRRLGVTALVLVLYRIGSAVPAPGVSYAKATFCAGHLSSSLSGLSSLFSGNALAHLGLLSLGVGPYVTASIIVQLLTAAVPALHTMSKDGKAGHEKITQITRYATVAVAALEGGLLAWTAGNGSLYSGCGPVVADTSVLAQVTLAAGFVTGALALLALAELVTDRGLGNGMSLLVTLSLTTRLPGAAHALWLQRGPLVTALVTLALVAVVAAVVLMEASVRKVPVRYLTGLSSAGTRTFLPLKLTQAGVVPVIFAGSALYLPQLAASLAPKSAFAGWVHAHLGSGSWTSAALLAALVLFFAFFYTVVTVDPVEIAEDLGRAGGFIPGVRPGAATAARLDQIVSRLMLAGAVFLAVLAVAPAWLLSASGLGNLVPLGGTSVLILVGVVLDLVRRAGGQLAVDVTPSFLDQWRTS